MIAYRGMAIEIQVLLAMTDPATIVDDRPESRYTQPKETLSVEITRDNKTAPHNSSLALLMCCIRVARVFALKMFT